MTASSPTVGDRATPPGKHRSLVRFAALGVALCLIGLAAVIGVRIVSNGEPSSLSGEVEGIPYHGVTGDEGCRNFAKYWITESGVGVSPDAIEQFTNCRQDADGHWVVAAELTGANDLAELPGGQLQAANELRRNILTGVDQINGSMPSVLADQVRSVYSEYDNPVIGHQREGMSISSIRNRYARVVNGVMLDPDYIAFADYLGWLMGNRIAGYNQLRRACLDGDNTGYLFQPCTGLEDNLSIRYAPWPWDLSDPVNVDAYLMSVYGDDGQDSQG